MKNNLKLPYVSVFCLCLLSVLSLAHSLEASKTDPQLDKLISDSKAQLIDDTKQLTFVGPRSGEGYFSADGSKIVFQSERDGDNPFYQIFVLDLKSGKSSRVSTGTGMTTCAWIHPSLKKVMWSSTHLDKNIADKVKNELSERAKPVKKKYSWSYDDQYDIFESDLNGKKIKRLTTELGYDAEGSYSPNGKYIAFASNRSQYSNEYSQDEKKIIERDSSYAMEIYIMNSNGKNVKRLTQSKGYDGGPFFSADGKKITWRRFSADGSKAEIFTMDIDGGNQKQVTSLNAMSWAPFFHPSGEYIIFASSVLGFANFELFIVDTMGLIKPIRVTNSEGFDGLAAFSPDGKKLSWTRRNEKGESQLYIGDWNHEKALALIGEQLNKKSHLVLKPSEFNSEFDSKDQKRIIQYLSSEELMGRATGSKEELLYVEQIESLFKAWGLEPLNSKGMVQKFEFTSSVTAGANNSFNFKGRMEKTLVRGQDYQVLSYSKNGEFKTAPIVFAGYGIKAPATESISSYDSYSGLDVKDKWVILLDHLPKGLTKEWNQHLLAYSRVQHKVTVAKNQGAAGVVFLTDLGLKEIKYEGSLSESSLPVLKLSISVFNEVLKKSEANYKSVHDLETAYSGSPLKAGFILKSQYFSATVDLVHNKSIGHNIIAQINPIKKNKSSAILIGAHGDHLGRDNFANSSLAREDEKGKIHYGADDNASGVAGVLELAHYFSNKNARSQLKKPLVFAIWSGEEIGVLGSNHFVKSWKSDTGKDFSESFEASLNMDMIGRFKDKLQIQGIGSAKEWSGLAEEVGLVSGLPVTLTTDPYLPTDAMSFYLAGIPSISFFTGTHEEYHSPRDTEDRINYKGLQKTIDVVRLFTEKISYVKAKVLTYNKVEGNSGQRLEGRSFRIYLGTIPDYSQEGVKGVRISGASKNSPAETAGLKTGDIITEFDNTRIENLYDYVYALQSAKPNEKVKLVIIRDGKNMELDITPTLKE